jgi:hypothetical protein
MVRRDRENMRARAQAKGGKRRVHFFTINIWRKLKN